MHTTIQEAIQDENFVRDILEDIDTDLSRSVWSPEIRSELETERSRWQARLDKIEKGK